ncbi:Shedu anti-phage system protein SduA domain-containing protein [Micromonospora zamorensis]|uniref:Shedu anti-phage system protein SduA domain-containing protein n=1 Tax=Micromonospora zamorensis TaxID=709883 RepID=UPI0037B60BB6
MRIRSDSTLRRLLVRIKELGGSEALQQLIDDALRHVGERRPYRGGRDLLTLLRYAEKVCRDDGDEDALERIEDALGYAMNTMLRPDVEIKYQLFADSRDKYLQQVRGTVALATSVALLHVDDVMCNNADATASDVREHLERLRDSPGFIVEDEHHPGRYREAGLDAQKYAWLREVLEDRLRTLPAHSDDMPVVPGQMDLDDLARVAQARVRAASLHDLFCVVNNRHSTENELQQAMQKNLWVFGGQYLPGLGKRRLLNGAELDLPLLRPDGSLHVVELKRANVRIVTHQRNGLVTTNVVHRAVGQAMNYLVGLDEDRAGILAEHGIDTRRASATVVVGHPQYQADLSAGAIEEVLRVYNSHLARLEVVTYGQLLERAARTLG